MARAAGCGAASGIGSEGRGRAAATSERGAVRIGAATAAADSAVDWHGSSHVTGRPACCRRRRWPVVRRRSRQFGLRSRARVARSCPPACVRIAARIGRRCRRRVGRRRSQPHRGGGSSIGVDVERLAGRPRACADSGRSAGAGTRTSRGERDRLPRGVRPIEPTRRPSTGRPGASGCPAERQARIRTHGHRRARGARSQSMQQAVHAATIAR